MSVTEVPGEPGETFRHRTPTQVRDAARDTYRSLRIAMVFAPLMLAISVGYQRAVAGCWETSLSGYYWTGAHGIFIAAMCTIGACLIIYKGETDPEDVALSFGGVLAWLVAIAPIQQRSACAGPGLPGGYDVAAGVRNNLAPVLLAGLVALIITAVQLWRRRRRQQGTYAFVAFGVGILIVVVVGALVLALTGDQVWVTKIHYVSAFSLFAFMITVAGLSAFRIVGRASSIKEYVRGYPGLYVAVAVTMLATLVFAGFSVLPGLPEWRYSVLVLEALLVAEFMAFWIIQTFELWSRAPVEPA